MKSANRRVFYNIKRRDVIGLAYKPVIIGHGRADRARKALTLVRQKGHWGFIFINTGHIDVGAKL